MKKKGIVSILVFMLIICLGLGGYGFYLAKFADKKEEKIPTITYEYYLDNVKVTKEEVTDSNDDINIDNNESISTEDNDENSEELEKDFLFYEYSCSNGVVGTFNEEKWEFEPELVKDSVCKLFFHKSKYEITLTVTNADIAEDSNMFVKREEDGVFNIIPHEGYELDTYTCSNNKEATWNSTNNTLAINAIVEDVTCKITFKLKTVKLDLSVVNGNGSTSETVNYGEKISAIIVANEGFENPTVKCTNNQNAVLNNNTVTIEKITNDTVCTVTFNPVKVEEYALTLEDLPYTIKITSGTTKQSIKKGDIGQFTLKPDEGFTIKSISCFKTGTPSETVTPSIKDNTDGSRTYSFLSMSYPITCKVEAQ